MNNQKDLIIFLDIDGVLNSKRKLIEIYNKYKKPFSCYDYPFDENCLICLKKIIELTKAKIVITSSWRKDINGINKINEILEKYDIKKYLIGYTPVINKERGVEIKAYLNALNYNPNYIILDDDSDMGDIIEHLIKIDSNVGITENNINECIKKLSLLSK